MEANSDMIGRRVELQSYIGTVRYHGPLVHLEQNEAEAKEEWLGIEWDVKERGKHNGTVNGHSYLKCHLHTELGPNTKCCSLIKKNKANWGIPIEEAIIERYQGYIINKEEEDRLEKALEEEMYVETISGRKRKIEMIGKEKLQNQQSKMYLLPEVVLLH